MVPLRLPVACAKAGLATPNGNYNLEHLLKPILRPGRVLLCGGCMDARGLKATEIAEGAARSSLAELTLAADKVIVSEGRVMPESTLTLGDGIGGVAAANALRKRLPRAHRIIVATADGHPPAELAGATDERHPKQRGRDRPPGPTRG